MTDREKQIVEVAKSLGEAWTVLEAFNNLGTNAVAIRDRAEWQAKYEECEARLLELVRG